MSRTLADMEGAETFDPASLGTCGEVCERKMLVDEAFNLGEHAWQVMRRECEEPACPARSPQAPPHQYGRAGRVRDK